MSPRKRLGNDPFEAQQGVIPAESQAISVNEAASKPAAKRAKKAAASKKTTRGSGADDFPEILDELKHTREILAKQQQEIASLKQELEDLKRKTQPNLAEFQRI